ncbi:hypothetical protein F5146DRAFT_1203769 [Armillaria mellea]|nr:hypothetical protein F5146DRAFT_1203769 [Armillaria mellea]
MLKIFAESTIPKNKVVVDIFYSGSTSTAAPFNSVPRASVGHCHYFSHYSGIPTSTRSRTSPASPSIAAHRPEYTHNLPTPSSDLGPPAVSASPTTSPSEPRSTMMNTPGPSFVFRSMATVTLEERMIRERKCISVENVDATLPPSVSEQVIDTKAMEAQLRQLVLASRRRKPKSTLTSVVEVSTPVAPRPLEDVSMEPAAVVTPPSTPSSSKSVEAVSRVSDRALDDLAISFITGAIATRQTPRERPIPTSPYRPSTAQAKQELAAQQRRLEQRITQSKALIAKLSLARTKPEKDEIMKLLRETSRAVEDDKNKSAKQTSTWPQASWDGILIISDDEDDMDLDSDDEALIWICWGLSKQFHTQSSFVTVIPGYGAYIVSLRSKCVFGGSGLGIVPFSHTLHGPSGVLDLLSRSFPVGLFARLPFISGTTLNEGKQVHDLPLCRRFHLSLAKWQL